MDRAKGLAIFLVVLGHLKADAYPAGNEWYEQLCLVLYKFHMPFFMFLTGLVMFHTYPEMNTWGDYFRYVGKKFLRFVPAYVLFALIIAAGKTVAGHFAPVERPVGGLWELLEVFVRPMTSYCRSLWYIYVVFAYFLIIPILLKLFRQHLVPLLAFAFALYFAPRTLYFAQGQIFEYMFIFLLGCYAALHLTSYTSLIDRYSLLFATIFGVSLIIACHTNMPKLVMGLLSIPALHSIVRLNIFQERSTLGCLGEYIFPIYLMNTIAIGVPRVLVQKYWSWDGRNFLFVFPVLLLCGLLLPIVVQRYFISKTPVLKEIIY